MTPLLSIRIAMMAGVLLFGAASWFIHRTPEWTAADPETMESLRTVARLLWALVAAGFATLYWRTRTPRSPAQLNTMAILGWALGETLALFGGVVYFLSAQPVWYVAGVLALGLAFVLFPGSRPA